MMKPNIVKKNSMMWKRLLKRVLNDFRRVSMVGRAPNILLR